MREFMKKKAMSGTEKIREAAWEGCRRFYGCFRKREGIDGILVTVGLCIIALLLCIVMKEQLSTFITTIVGNLTTKAQGILGM